MRLKPENNKKGFTIIELMIALLITALAISAIYATFVAQQRSFTAQDQISETQGSSKVAFNLLVDAVRNAGFGYPRLEAPVINGFAGGIGVEESGDDGGPDSITLVGGYRQVGTLAEPAVIGLDTITISYLDSNAIVNLEDRMHITFDGVGYARIADCTLEDDRCSAADNIVLDRGINKPYPAGRPIYVLEDITYCVDDNSSLMKRQRGADAVNCTEGNFIDTIADNIDDLQFAYAVDTDGDGLINDDFPGGNNNGIFDPGDFITPPFPFNSRVMAVRLNILARTRQDNPNIESTTKPFHDTGITLENNTTPDDDQLTRKFWTMETFLRNAR
jgi:prepilin-type N-terminal cleavage/methylation domain-containing protein